MRLSSFRVRNLRSVCDTGEFSILPLFALVGENNTGKSNILRAIEVLLSAGTGKLGRADFYNPEMPIVIKGVFTELSPIEKKRWRPYLISDALSLEKHISLVVDEKTKKERLETEFHGYRAEPKIWYLSLAKIHTEKGERPKWADIVKENGLPESFSEDGKSNKIIYGKALIRYLEENEVEYDDQDLSATQALGLQSNVVASLPSVHLLSAVSNYSDEIDKRSSSSTFRKLMAVLSDRILERDSRYVELENTLANFRQLLNFTTSEGAAPRIEALGVIEAKITDILRKMMPSVSGVSLTVEIEELKELFSAGVALSVNDGVDTDVLSKGHGLQRCIVFTLLQTLILNERNQLIATEDSAEATTNPIILLVEEPELYIHPQLAKLFYDVLVSFAVTDQVIYSTHSSLFVDAYEPERVAIITKPDAAIGTQIRCFDVKAFEGLDDRKQFQGFTKLNPAMNELFFAKRVLLVEGPQDYIAVTETLKKLGNITTRPEELEWSIIACGGKPAIPSFQRVMNAFKIPYAVLHDLDITQDMPPENVVIHKRLSNTITSLAAGNPVHLFDVRLEHSLGLDYHFDNQYDAHLLLSDHSNITSEVEEKISAIFS